MGTVMTMLVRILVFIGSSMSIGFGIWHLFVPRLWNWYSYIDVRATELIIAVRAINVFFSLSLILFGIVNVLFIYGTKSNRYSIAIMLAAACVLWLARIVFQLIYPQGSMSPLLQYGMLSIFVIIFLFFAIPLCIVLFKMDNNGFSLTQGTGPFAG
jgi:hypothetical protein